jgi:hypothetical protein
MVHADILPDPRPVEEIIERVGVLPAAAVVPSGHFALILTRTPSPLEPGVARYLRAGEVAVERCELYRLRRRR